MSMLLFVATQGIAVSVKVSVLSVTAWTGSKLESRVLGGVMLGSFPGSPSYGHTSRETRRSKTNYASSEHL